MSEKKEQDIELLILDLVEKFSKRDRFDSFIAAVLKEIHAHDFSESRKLIYLNKNSFLNLIKGILEMQSKSILSFLDKNLDENY